MALSKFNVFIDNVLFNTLTGYAIELDQKELELLKRGEVPGHLKGIIEEGFSSGFRDLENTVENFLKKPILEPTLLLTYNCNFDCSYCFQKGFRKDLSVSDRVIRGFINYILKNHNGRKVRVTYFGGEPLLELRRIEEISKSLPGVDYSFSLVTNGSMLTKGVVDRLTPLGLSHVQITLDGPREVHDRRRYYIDGRGSFDVIVKNLRELQDRVKVVLRVNIDVHNFHEVDKLLDELKSEGISNVRLDPHLVHTNLFRNEWWENVIPRETESDVLLTFWQKAHERGFKIPQDIFRLGLCVAYVDEDIVVDPEGKIYPCWAFTGNHLYVKGRLEEDGTLTLNEKLLGRKTLRIREECKECPFLPLCFGGCRFLSVLEGKGYNGLDCRREAYEKIVKLVKNIMR
ncbi:radical SAM protein [Metallosphaera tengchongensis]|uniref:Radical SAM protein n=1 Tax=Metallosphaera tengchongensis TaxID=1532350 RepID=A0A6N0NXH8_9CREN|nr:radical SAM protein [Metallosphaera tengchongensis]QKR00309.1 radical SAM protein [Metallosphaera tengchongensis]